MQFLVIENNPAKAELLARTLTRAFSTATAQIVTESGPAISSLCSETFDAIIVHHTLDHPGAELTYLVRKLAANTPIIAIATTDCSVELLQAGATAFLNYAEWLRLPSVVRDVLSPAPNHPD